MDFSIMFPSDNGSFATFTWHGSEGEDGKSLMQRAKTELYALNNGLTLPASLINTFEETKADAVIRMEKTEADGTVTPFITFYGAWNEEKTFGFYGTASVYFNADQPERLVEFENATGLKFADLPVYNGDGAPTRKYGVPHKYIIQLPQVTTIRKNVYVNKDGVKKSYFAGYSK